MSFLREITRRQRAALLEWNLEQIGDVDSEPIDLETARAHCRVDLFGSPPESDDDFWLENIGAPGAREHCEFWLGRALASRTIELSADGFPSVCVSNPPGPCIELPFGPVQSITSVEYLDQAAADAAYQEAYDAEFGGSGDADAAAAAGDAAAALALDATMDPATYALDASRVPARLVLAYGTSSWPIARSAIGSVKVRYVTGYSNPGDSPQVRVLPKSAMAAMLLMLGHLYKNREAVNVTAQVAEVPLGVKALLEIIPGRERISFA